MKRILLSIIFLFSLTLVIAQSVDRQMVVLEIGTGTWCQYCPGASMGADDLIENGKHVAVIENHNGDSYANTYSNARNSLYGISSFPTAVFDGLLKVVGGSHTQSMYASYLPKYNQRIAVPSNILMDMVVSNVGLDYTADITLTKVGTFATTDPKLFLAVTQSHIQQNWQGQDHLNFVNRLMVPNQNGTPISFTSGDVQTIQLTWTMNAAWPVEDCEFVIWVQGASPSKEVLNGFKRAAVDLNVDFSAPVTTINQGDQASFTNLTTGGYIDAPETYTWLFPGAIPIVSTDENPTVTYRSCGPHDVTLIVDRGGQIDTVVKTAYITVNPIAKVMSGPSDTTCIYQPITLNATNIDAISYLWTPGGDTTASITVDGWAAGVGSHTYTVEITTTCGVADTTHTIVFDACTGIRNVNQDVKANIFPNPSNGSFTLELNAGKATTADLSITNSLGSVVYQENNLTINNKVVKNLNLNLASGVYFLNLQTPEGKVTQKLVISK
jgi:PKD repeat protein